MTTLLEATTARPNTRNGHDPRSDQDHGPRLLIELQPKTRAGAQLVASAELLARRLGATAAEHDTRGTYPLENVALLKEAGYFVAPIPPTVRRSGR